MDYKKNRFALSLILGFWCLIFLASFVYEFSFKGEITPAAIKYDSEGNVAGSAPFSPSLAHPLGTDRNGNDIVLRILEGAKYTLGFAIGVTFFRILLSFVLASLLTFQPPVIKGCIEKFFIPFQFIPSFILAAFFLMPIAQLDEQFLTIIFIGIPPIIILIKNEMELKLKNDYIQASYLLGASNVHILRKQLIPVLKPQFKIVFLQQLISTLQVLIHLGIFELFIGGVIEGGTFGDDEGSMNYLSYSGEWAGMIGQSKFELMTAPWIILGPGLAFVILFLSLNNILKRLNT
jgi:peptide/nickel transport system permease protein